MELDQRMQAHARLRAERCELTNDSNRPTDDPSVIERLNYKLMSVRRRHADMCERFITIRNSQIREVEEVNAAMAIAPPPQEDLPPLPPTASIVLLRQALAGVTGLDSGTDSPAQYQWDA
jgi:hypothetical protein